MVYPPHTTYLPPSDRCQDPPWVSILTVSGVTDMFVNVHFGSVWELSLTCSHEKYCLFIIWPSITRFSSEWRYKLVLPPMHDCPCVPVWHKHIALSRSWITDSLDPLPLRKKKAAKEHHHQANGEEKPDYLPNLSVFGTLQWTEVTKQQRLWISKSVKVSEEEVDMWTVCPTQALGEGSGSHRNAQKELGNISPPVTHLLALSSKSTPQFLLREDGAGPWKYLSSACWHTMTLGQ